MAGCPRIWERLDPEGSDGSENSLDDAAPIHPARLKNLVLQG